VRVLLLNSNRPEPIRILEDDPTAVRIAVTEPNCAHLYRPDAWRVLVVADLTDLTAVQQAAVTAMREVGVDHVVAATERTQLVAALVRATLGVPGLSFDTAQVFTHKYAMKQRLRAAGLPVADFARAGSLDDVADVAPGWPVVVKPVYGGGCIDTVKADTPEQLVRMACGGVADGLRHTAYPLAVERFVDISHEYHCDGIVERGMAIFASVACHLRPVLQRGRRIEGSFTFPRDAHQSQVILDLHQKAVTALGLRDGVTHMELFETDGGWLIGEIACRPAGGWITDLVCRHHGVDLWDAHVRLSVGRPAPRPSAQADGILLRCLLPLAVGTVRKVTPVEELAILPGVVHAEVTVRPGAVVSPPLHSGKAAGVVFARVSDLAGVEIAVSTVE
jgi:biotin carboxylase